MFVFGHAGLTLGAALVIAGTARGRSSSRLAVTNQLDKPLSKESTQSNRCGALRSWLEYLAGKIDLRLLLIGSLLPDIIDKPISHYFLRETFSNGRIFSHTLLFLITITLVGLCVYRWLHQNWLLVLAFGTFTHLILDMMWFTPRTFYWPLYGFTFERMRLGYMFEDIIRLMRNEPLLFTLICSVEFMGAIIIGWFLWSLIRRRRLIAFIRRGIV